MSNTLWEFQKTIDITSPADKWGLAFDSLHTLVLTTQKLDKMHWITLDHALYSLDFSPCDFLSLWVECFANEQQIEQFVHN